MEKEYVPPTGGEIDLGGWTIVVEVDVLWVISEPIVVVV